jgi:zinc D-Ala-D-Ala carboxypeptidase
MAESSEHFSREELECSETGECNMDPDFLALLEKVRVRFGKPMKLSSAYRSPEHSVEKDKPEKRKNGYHVQGRAVDVLIYHDEALRLIHIALTEGIKGIGISQKGPHESRFVHLDNRETRMIWSY